jgi:hypothetical protein
VRPWPWQGHEWPGIHSSDVDGDGRVLTMRLADPNGAWVEHPEDTRVMVPVPVDGDTGERPRYRLITEGHVVAHDGFVDDKGYTGAYAVEFWPTDPVKARNVNVAFDPITEAVPFAAGKLGHHPEGDTQEALAATEAGALKRMKVPVLSVTALFAGVKFPPLNQATGVGVLRVVHPRTRRRCRFLRATSCCSKAARPTTSPMSPA